MRRAAQLQCNTCSKELVKVKKKKKKADKQ